MSKIWPRDTPRLLNVIEFAPPEFIGPTSRDRIWSSTFSLKKKKNFFDCFEPWLWRVGSSSLTRDWTRAPALGAQSLVPGPPGKSPACFLCRRNRFWKKSAGAAGAASPSQTQGGCRVHRLFIWWCAAEMKTRALCVCFSLWLWGGCWRRLQGLTWSLSVWGQYCPQEVKGVWKRVGARFVRALGMFVAEVLGEGPGMTEWPAVWGKLAYRAASRSQCREHPIEKQALKRTRLGKHSWKASPKFEEKFRELLKTSRCHGGGGSGLPFGECMCGGFINSLKRLHSEMHVKPLVHYLARSKHSVTISHKRELDFTTGVNFVCLFRGRSLTFFPVVCLRSEPGP